VLKIGQAAMMGVMEDIAELTYTHGLTTFVSPSPVLERIKRRKKKRAEGR
jgi:hypothetical protein